MKEDKKKVDVEEPMKETEAKEEKKTSPVDDLMDQLGEAKKTAEEAKNKAEQVVYQAEKMMKDNGDKIPADTKSQLQAAIDEIKSKKDNGSKEEIDAAVNKLQSMISSMAGAAQGAPNAGASAEPHAEPKKDNGKDGPIDADYTVVDDDKK